MATTIQIVENLRIGRYIEVDGQRCEVERSSFSKAIDRKLALEELVLVMSTELLERKVIAKDQAGVFFWVETGEPLIPEDEFEDQ
ncbi:hypothetical protein [Photobacterium damselae]|uniref:hypothetical protein n=1 Tax=Photobacterium damselae TaxID=38293 RepID=UPI004068637E